MKNCSHLRLTVVAQRIRQLLALLLVSFQEYIKFKFEFLNIQSCLHGHFMTFDVSCITGVIVVKI